MAKTVIYKYDAKLKISRTVGLLTKNTFCGGSIFSGITLPSIIVINLTVSFHSNFTELVSSSIGQGREEG